MQEKKEEEEKDEEEGGRTLWVKTRSSCSLDKQCYWTEFKGYWSVNKDRTVMWENGTKQTSQRCTAAQICTL